MFSHCCFSVVCHHACLSLFLKYCIHMEEHYQEERYKQHHPTSWHSSSPCRPYEWNGLRQLLGRQWSMGVIIFIADMFLMFLGSTFCHLPPPGTCAWCHAPSRPYQHTRHDSLLLPSHLCLCLRRRCQLDSLRHPLGGRGKDGGSGAHSEDLPPPPSLEVCQISCPLTECPGHPPSHPPYNP